LTVSNEIEDFTVGELIGLCVLWPCNRK